MAWAAFGDLSGDRQVGMGFVGTIPFVALDRWAERAGITDPDEFARLHHLIRSMDTEWQTMNAPKGGNAQRR